MKGKGTRGTGHIISTLRSRKIVLNAFILGLGLEEKWLYILRNLSLEWMVLIEVSIKSHCISQLWHEKCF